MKKPKAVAKKAKEEDLDKILADLEAQYGIKVDEGKEMASVDSDTSTEVRFY